MLMGLPEFNDIDPPMEKVSQFFGFPLFHVLDVDCWCDWRTCVLIWRYGQTWCKELFGHPKIVS